MFLQVDVMADVVSSSEVVASSDLKNNDQVTSESAKKSLQIDVDVQFVKGLLKWTVIFVLPCVEQCCTTRLELIITVFCNIV
jgi:hypothetical protein